MRLFDFPVSHFLYFSRPQLPGAPVPSKPNAILQPAFRAETGTPGTPLLLGPRVRVDSELAMLASRMIRRSLKLSYVWAPLLLVASSPWLGFAPLARADASCEVAVRFDPDSWPPGFQDYEITVDPEDPEQNLLLTSNVTSVGPSGSDIFVMRLDGLTGMASGRPRMLSGLYTGRAKVNGPEFAYHPIHGLGILYASVDGVHAAWRINANPWWGFGYDLGGKLYRPDEPSALPPTIPNRHPNDSQPFGREMYGEIDFEANTCGEVCYAYYEDSTTTDMRPILRETLQFDLGRSAPHPTADGYVIFSGCTKAVPPDCGIFEVQIDGAGGILVDTAAQLFSLPQDPPPAYHAIEAAIHPSSGKLMVFILHGGSLTAWEASGAHAPLRLFGQLTDLPTWRDETPDHLRLIDADDVLIAQVFMREGPDIGSWTAVVDDRLHPIQNTLPVDPSGSELIFLPAANRLAQFLPYTVRLGGAEIPTIVRCWIDF